ncbi:RNA polymerase factor sigma-54 [Oceanicella sp. SM1341]|uniref:RNA polymerase factor sigma-54 n=1 Tax=Oceanicella sp. SM1341 TaxID=1548889 RepID=UPI000E548AA0|nr:RNA polymerase factor sigma-54 [Oceanicella sp. SM1341]
MGLGQRLELRQTTQLVMTPQLQQAIRLLQMSSIDLGAFVAEEVEKNPILEMDSAEGSAPASAEAPEPRLEDRLRDAAPGQAEADLDTTRESLYDEAVADGQAAWTRSAGAGGGGASFSDGSEPGDTLSGTPTLRDHLAAQIRLAPGGAERRAVALFLVDELDEAGYLARPLPEISDQLGAGEALVAEALALLQACEPVGVGARSLAECLALQLRERDRLDPAMQAVLENLELLAAGKFARLAEIAGLEPEDLPEIIAEIRALDPRPGHAFGHLDVQTVVADVFVRRNGLGAWAVELNSDALPRVLVNNTYAARVAASGAEATAFISECRSSASWLVKTLESRARTILKVATEITRHQEAFFDIGVAGLRPLTLREVAEAVGMHESTISRVTSGKYLSCERGLFELRYFFSQGLASSDGGAALSATAIRERIRRMIEQEDPARILSDDTLVDLLQKDGVDIARRTVAKYREGLNIPSSVKRRRLKAGLIAR